MGNIVQAAVVIEGMRPLWWHRFGPEALPLQKQEKTGVAGHDPEEWRRTVLATSKGQLYIEPTYIFGAIRDGAKYTKKGRGTLQRVVVATLQVVDPRILVDRWLPGFPSDEPCELGTMPPPPSDPELPVYLDIRGVRNPSTRGRNVRYRVAASPGWRCAFAIQWDKTIVSREQMEAILIDTGKLVGVGNGRSIGMGRFDIVEFTVTDG